jgi:hypothetical protein
MLTIMLSNILLSVTLLIVIMVIMPSGSMLRLNAEFPHA